MNKECKMKDWVLGLLATCVAASVLADGPKTSPLWGVAPDGTVWTEHSERFIYAPTLAFAAVDGAASYRCEVIDDFHVVRRLESVKPTISLSGLWDELPVGYVTVFCRAFGGDGRLLSGSGLRTLWKKAAFEPARYERRSMSYGLACTRMFENYLDLEQTKVLARTGNLDLDSYSLNGYPSKMLSAEIVALCAFARSGVMREVDGDAQIEIARKAGDFLIAYSVPKGSPLEYLPRTYHERGSEYGRFKDEQDRIFLVYPAEAGRALVVLFKTTGERMYLDAARRIAGTYIKLQESDGTWPVMLNAKTGERYTPNRLVPLDVMLFMEALHAETGVSDYRACSDRAFGFLERGPMRDWNWEGQFEDGGKEKITPHLNLSNFPANMMAQYLLRRFPDDPARIAQAECLCKFVEDQFVDWEPPYGNGRDAREYRREDDGSLRWFCRPISKWCTPCVMEQYMCYVPVNGSSARTIKTLLALWRATGKAAYLEKAKALGDSLTRMVEPDGFANTWMLKGVKRTDHRHHTWINCTLEAATALGELSAAVGERKEIRK